MTYSFVISRSTVQFRPLAPYNTVGYRIPSVANFGYVGKRDQTGAALYRFVSSIDAGVDLINICVNAHKTSMLPVII